MDTNRQNEATTATTLKYVDTKSFQRIYTEDVEIFQQNLDSIYDWASKTSREFNGGKFKLLHFGANQEIKGGTLLFSPNMEEVIGQVANACDFGY